MLWGGVGLGFPPLPQSYTDASLNFTRGAEAVVTLTDPRDPRDALLWRFGQLSQLWDGPGRIGAFVPPQEKPNFQRAPRGTLSTSEDGAGQTSMIPQRDASSPGPLTVVAHPTQSL